MRSSQHPLLSLAPTTLTCLLFLAGGFLVYGASGHDDAHITFWAAHTLAERGAITNYNGDAVQQSSSLLLTLLTAALHLLTGLKIPDAGYLAGLFGSAGSCILLFKLSDSYRWRSNLLLLSTPSFLLWTYSGMEATLAALCLLACIVSWSHWLETTNISIRLLLAATSCTTALVLVRPEMPLVALAMATGSALYHYQNAQRYRRSMQLLAVSVVLSTILFCWQKLYFNNWLPMPVAAKQGSALLMHWRPGAWYLLLSSGMNPVLPLALLAAVALAGRQQYVAAPSQHSMYVLAGGALVIYALFVVAVGGDWMQAARFVVPVLPVASLLLTAWMAEWRAIWLAQFVTLMLVCIQLVMQFFATSQQSHGVPVWTQYRLAAQHQDYASFEKLNQEHLRDMAVIDHLADIIPPLHAQLGRPVTLLSGQAGMVFYHTAARFAGEVQFHDLRGLVENSLTSCPATRDITRAQQGLFWGYRDFFARLPALEQQCGIARPDIIYDLNDMNQKLGRTLDPLGYTMVHQETGFPVENRTSLPYNRLLAPNMIFVRSDLLPLLGHQAKTVVDYHQLPLQSRWPWPDQPVAP